MTEKAFKTMGNAGAAALATGIIMIVTGIACGVVLLISGGRLFSAKKGIDILGRTLWFESKE